MPEKLPDITYNLPQLSVTKGSAREYGVLAALLKQIVPSERVSYINRLRTNRGDCSDLPVKVLAVSQPTIRLLTGMGVKTLADLKKFTAEDLVGRLEVVAAVTKLQNDLKLWGIKLAPSARVR